MKGSHRDTHLGENITPISSQKPDRYLCVTHSPGEEMRTHAATHGRIHAEVRCVHLTHLQTRRHLAGIEELLCLHTSPSLRSSSTQPQSRHYNWENKNTIKRLKGGNRRLPSFFSPSLPSTLPLSLCQMFTFPPWKERDVDRQGEKRKKSGRGEGSQGL